MMNKIKSRWLGFTFTVSALSVFLIFSPPSYAKAKTTLKPSVLLISLDGFRYDYFDKYHPKNLEAIAAQGVKAEALIPVFPSLTFPNHYTIVTGLYPAKHGIISNDMKDPTIMDPNKPTQLWKFSLGNTIAMDDPRWWQGEPIWLTVENQGQKSGTMFWPGSNVPIQGKLPSYFKKYSGSVTSSDRVKQVLNWLDLPDADRPTFFTLYFEAVDSAGHKYGPDSPEVKQAVADVDQNIGDLMAELKKRGIDQQLNVIIVSDHGMSAVKANHVINISQYIDLKEVDVISTGAVTNINPLDPKDTDTIYNALVNAHPNLKVYKKSQIPARFQYTGNTRIPEIVGIADEDWYISTKANTSSAATHGYDNANPNMHGIFLADGPAFKDGVTVAPFENIHIYELMANILGLKPAKNDGDLNIVKPLLK